jgi:uridine kinase
MLKFSCLQNFTNHISCLVTNNKAHLISIDGVDGSGKSYLSKILIKENNYSYIDIDGDYLVPNNGKYIEYIKYRKLKSDVTQLLSSNMIVVVDGICTTRTLKNIDFFADIKVYVKKIILGKWRDGRSFDYSRNVKDVLAEKRKEAQEFENDEAYIEGKEPQIFNYSEENMKDEILRYHFEYQPENNADIIFERIMNMTGR